MATLEQMIKQGNHTKDPENKKILAELICRDINYSYGLTLAIKTVWKIKLAEVYPMNVVHQETVNKLGETVPKTRASHDLSFQSKPREH